MFLSATEFSVADYDSTPCAVVVVVVVVVGMIVQIKNGITFELLRYQLDFWYTHLSC